jgi:hypothetical protein
LVLGFRPRCARETGDSGEVRLAKIERLMQECQFEIHDISAVELDPVHQLPGFNIPLELGIFSGCKRFGSSAQKIKIRIDIRDSFLILQDTIFEPTAQTRWRQLLLFGTGS